MIHFDGLGWFVRTIINWSVCLAPVLVLVCVGGLIIYLLSTRRLPPSGQSAHTSPTSVEGKRLYRSKSDCVFAGVCGGLAQYLGVDPTIVRIVTAILFLLGAVGWVGIAYLVAWLVMPVEPA